MLRDYLVVICLIKYIKEALLKSSRYKGAQYYTFIIDAVELD